MYSCTLQLKDQTIYGFKKVTFLHTNGNTMDVISGDLLAQLGQTPNLIPGTPLPIKFDGKTQDSWSVTLTYNNPSPKDQTVFSIVNHPYTLTADSNGKAIIAKITGQANEFYLELFRDDKQIDHVRLAVALAPQ